MNENPNDPHEVLSELQHGLGEARKLVERTRSLLAGERPYDEGEESMIVRERSGQSQSN